MKIIYFLWYQFNWLEFVTYILIPTSIILVLLTYILFNIKLLKLSFDFDIEFLTDLDKKYKKTFKSIVKKLEREDIFNNKW
jgi:hypothetical protein